MPNLTRHSRAGGNPQQLITHNLNIWTAVIKKRGSQGRGSNKKIELYGIKKLRELILELAVRGLLVPQNPNDEPASVLLEKIAAEKGQLIKDGKIRKQKPLPEITDDEKPFELPKGWSWARFPNVCSYGPGKTPSTKSSMFWEDSDIGIPWVSIADMRHHQLLTDTAKRISIKAREDVFKKEPVKAGTLIMSFKLTLGKISKLGIDAYHNEAIISVNPFSGVYQDYIYHILPSRVLSGNAKKAIKGNTLNSESLALITVPIPPEAEQPRIVAKVDELMALCDQLEQQTESSLTAHQTLVDTLLKSLLDAAQLKPGHNSTGNELGKNNDPFQSAWNLIADHFNELFVTEHSIDQLKQTILQLAVMGKLVPQNPNDEPASVLLEKIAAEKEQLIKDGKIKKQKALPEISEDEKPFELPKGWEWLKVDDVLEFTKRAMITGPFGSALRKNEHQSSGTPVWGIESIKDGKFTGKNKIFVTNEKALELKSFNAVPGDIIISRSGTIDEICKMPPEAGYGLISTNLLRLSINESIVEPEYFCFIFKGSEFVLRRLKELCFGSTRLFLNQKILKSLIYPIPPIEEQDRIVIKVDELMVLCDTLKERIRESQTTQLHLADAMAEQALNE